MAFFTGLILISIHGVCCPLRQHQLKQKHDWEAKIHCQSDPGGVSYLKTKGGEIKGDGLPLYPVGTPSQGPGASFSFTCNLTLFSLH